MKKLKNILGVIGVVVGITLSSGYIVYNEFIKKDNIYIGENGNWYINGKDTGNKAVPNDGKDGIDGVSVVSIIKTGSTGNIDTYTITYSDGTTSTFTVTNGEDGEQGIQGDTGADGHTPVITIGEDGYWYVDGVKTNTKAQGEKGDTGDTGDSAFEIFKKYHPEYTGTEEDWINAITRGDICSTLGEHVAEDEITITSDYNLEDHGSRSCTYTCKFCNQTIGENLIYPEDKEIYTINDVSYVNYGYYPQTRVNDSAIINILENSEPTDFNGWYKYNGEYYTSLSANPCRDDYTFDDGTSIVNGTNYWFKCERITWRVLSNSDNKCYLLSNKLLDTQIYGEAFAGTKSKTDYNNNTDTVYANNYQYSEIRGWLNTTFYNAAFALDNSAIQTTIVDNSASTLETSSNTYACSNTNDKVFLPSYQDYKNTSYGFDIEDTASSKRYCITTDYARAKYASSNDIDDYLYNGYYWTRSPESEFCVGAWVIFYNGQVYSNPVNTTAYCVRPAITLSIA